MFTGIIEEVGTVMSVKSSANAMKLTIRAPKVTQDINMGDSIAVNGICLTACGLGRESFTVDVMGETLSRTSLKGLRCGSHVNLERALTLNGRLGGHIVSGHIDGTGTVTTIKNDDIARLITISAPQAVMDLIVEKGSVAVDGISLTVASVSSGDFTVSVIPHTMDNTILTEKTPGDTVNLENDCIGKYVRKLMELSEHEMQDAAARRCSGKSRVTAGFLTENGFF
ncbi:MAG TPA: riboflavin synthase [Candidatus Fimisoma avicola]|uniref:Riboflavin synthase n=1 Tax=Candidatus Fimisoma avicola TaxID=2840826 RepID=A0A9D1I692_9FIRM|nr:riboflavin synthase [Candidatus Fimisoma avicola]